MFVWQAVVFKQVVQFSQFWRIAVALRDFPTDRQITRHTRTNIYLFVSNSLQRAFLCVSICGFLAAGERVSKWLTATLEFWTQRATFEDLGPSDIWSVSQDKKTKRQKDKKTKRQKDKKTKIQKKQQDKKTNRETEFMSFYALPPELGTFWTVFGKA